MDFGSNAVVRDSVRRGADRPNEKRRPPKHRRPSSGLLIGLDLLEPVAFRRLGVLAQRGA
ncbi:MAG: hypothetical protein JWL94_1123 [Microbacteriaceae bacterium]|jgi:hypothetical protein|nr:hypothetical protein [Microbacteriaceae bacterium]